MAEGQVKPPWEQELEAQVLAEEKARREAAEREVRERREALLAAAGMHDAAAVAADTKPVIAVPPPPGTPTEPLTDEEIERRERELLEKFEQERLLSHEETRAGELRRIASSPATNAPQADALLGKVDELIEQRRSQMEKPLGARRLSYALQSLRKPEWFILGIGVVLLLIVLLSMWLRQIADRMQGSGLPGG
jgi:hypothetical protein